MLKIYGSLFALGRDIITIGNRLIETNSFAGGHAEDKRLKLCSDPVEQLPRVNCELNETLNCNALGIGIKETDRDREK